MLCELVSKGDLALRREALVTRYIVIACARRGQHGVLTGVCGGISSKLIQNDAHEFS